MLQIELQPKLRKTLVALVAAALAACLCGMLLAVQQALYKGVLVGLFHVSGAFEYWREIMLNLSFTAAALLALVLLVLAKCPKIAVKSSSVFAACIFASFAITQMVFMFNRWTTGIDDGRYDFGDMFKACAASINMGEDICPPSSMLMYQIMRNTMPGLGQGGLAEYNAVLANQTAGYYIQLYFIFAVAPLAVLCYRSLKGTSAQKAFFAVAVMLSRPAMIAFERANSIIQALSLVMLFVLCYRSKEPLAREIALLALAVAFSFKIYTAVFGILLLREKDYKGAARCAAYALFLFIFPNFCHRDGAKSMMLYIQALSGYMNNLDFGLNAAQLSLKRVVTLLCIAIRAPNAYGALYPLCMALYIALSVFVVLKSKKEWHILFVCALATIVVPGLSWPYTAVFLLIPLVELFNSGGKNWADYASIACMLFVFVFAQYKLCKLTEIFFSIGNWWAYLLLVFALVAVDTALENRYTKQRS